MERASAVTKERKRASALHTMSSVRTDTRSLRPLRLILVLQVLVIACPYRHQATATPSAANCAKTTAKEALAFTSPQSTAASHRSALGSDTGSTLRGSQAAEPQQRIAHLDEASVASNSSQQRADSLLADCLDHSDVVIPSTPPSPTTGHLRRNAASPFDPQPFVDTPSSSSSGTSCFHYGVASLRFSLPSLPANFNPYLDLDLQLIITMPNAAVVTVDAFYNGSSMPASASGHEFIARVYCGQTGTYVWQASTSVSAWVGLSGTVTSGSAGAPTGWHGKLRQHELDPHQFQYDDGTWFLHIGDTGYRFLSGNGKEPMWKEYIDQASNTMFATKVRTWFNVARHTVGDVYTSLTKQLQLPYWQTMEAHIDYALQRQPGLQLQLIIYGEDWGLMTPSLAAAPDSAKSITAYIARYAQARWSSYPNVQWCIINDISFKKYPSAISSIEAVGAAMAAREPWGTLITSHQARSTGYAFPSSSWSSIVSLETEDAFLGKQIVQWRAGSKKVPVVLDEDRYETYKTPRSNIPDWYRRYMWAAVVSGGHASYGGIQTWRGFSQLDMKVGMRGYGDLVAAGVLKGGRDFMWIHKFFTDTGKTMVGLAPAFANCGNNAKLALCSNSPDTMIVYATVLSPTAVRVTLPSAGAWTAVCYSVTTGAFSSEVSLSSLGSGAVTSFTCPTGSGFVNPTLDRVILFTRA